MKNRKQHNEVNIRRDQSTSLNCGSMKDVGWKMFFPHEFSTYNTFLKAQLSIKEMQQVRKQPENRNILLQN